MRKTGCMKYENNENEIRRQIVEAGLRLLDSGLVSRTWGNISARLSGSSFVITPSGRSYRLTAPSDLVAMGIFDLNYDKKGPRPSSEHGIHAAVYRLRPEAKFVIHTHQFYASAVGAALRDAVITESLASSGKSLTIPCAEYGEPGTKDLWDKVEKALALHPEEDCFLMARHGALIIGDSMEQAFAKALQLEELCRALFEEKVPEARGLNKEELAALTGKDPLSLPPYLDDYAQMVPLDYGNDDEEALKTVSEKNAAAFLYAGAAPPLSQKDALAQHEGYVRSYSRRIKQA